MGSLEVKHEFLNADEEEEFLYASSIRDRQDTTTEEYFEDQTRGNSSGKLILLFMEPTTEEW